jgi:hypothetical protein
MGSTPLVSLGVRTDSVPSDDFQELQSLQALGGIFRQWRSREWPEDGSSLRPSARALRHGGQLGGAVDRCPCVFRSLLIEEGDGTQP